MNFARLKFWGKTSHHMLVLLDTAEALEQGTFDVNFPVVRGTSEVHDLDGFIGIFFAKTLLHLIYVHGTLYIRG